MRLHCLTLAVATTLSAPLLAGDIVVVAGGSIQAAIDAAVPGDRVLVQPGTYLEQIDFSGKAIEVIGLQGASQTIIDGAGTGPVVRFANGEGSDSKLSGITVTGGYATYGAGGINCGGSVNPTIADCIVRNNRGKFGGGVSASPTMRRCAIVSNTASLTPGGGILGAPQLSYCLIAGNTATSADGGGLYLSGLNTHSVVDHCIVIDNRAILAGSNGEGIFLAGSARATITNTVVAGNSATGGVFLGRGGGISIGSPGTLIINSTIVDNSVSGSSTLGAGIYGPAEIRNSIVRGNLGADQIDNPTLVEYSDVEGGYPGAGNLDVDPGFVDEAAREYHLLAESPLIDVGDLAIMDPDGG